jgi:flagellar basal body-associated protein FliL
MDEKKQRTANTGLAKVAVQCSADTFVVNHLRQARKRYAQCQKTPYKNEQTDKT